MKRALIRLLLRWLGVPVPIMPNFYFYAIVKGGDRIADVTTNPNRARASARHSRAVGNDVRVFRCVPVSEESP